MAWTERVRDFVKDVRVESAKVSWPTRAELRDSTIVVIITVAIVSAFVGLVDRVLSAGVSLVPGNKARPRSGVIRRTRVTRTKWRRTSKVHSAGLEDHFGQILAGEDFAEMKDGKRKISAQDVPFKRDRDGLNNDTRHVVKCRGDSLVGQSVASRKRVRRIPGQMEPEEKRCRP
jgi:preprotein translocase subunit SecE